MPPSNPTAAYGISGQDTHTLVVQKGRQAGARADIYPDAVVTIGTGLDNDVVLYSHGASPCQLTVTGTADTIEIVVVEGVVLKDGEPLAIGVIHEVAESEEFAMADSVFSFEFALPDVDDEESVQPVDSKKGQNSQQSEEASITRPLTYLYIVGGLILLTSVVTTGLVRAFQNEDNRKQSLQSELAAAGYENLYFVPAQGSLPARISGAVFSVDDRAKILALAAETNTNVQLDLQVNDELASAVTDIYRVNGISADVNVTGIGEVEVWTSTRNVDSLINIESSVKTDIPDVLSLTTSNSLPAEKVVEPTPVAEVDPEKQVTLVVAGADGYIMTRDKSRYFIGSMLPSGHIIKKISDGKVFVEAADGQALVLDFN